MATIEQRAAWKTADAALSTINAEREALLEPTRERHDAALARLAEAEELIGEPVATCEGCAEPIFEGEPMCSGDTPTCLECSPTYAALLDPDAGFTGADDEPLTIEACRALYDGHIAAGGLPTDSMAR